MSKVVATRYWPLSVEDPYAALRQLRDAAPVHWFSSLEAYLVVSYSVARAVLHGQNWSSDPANFRTAGRLAVGAAGTDVLTRSVLFADAPLHTRLRSSLRPWLTPRAIEGGRDRISAIVRAALSGCPEMGPLELMDSVAYPVPLAVICELLAAPPELAARLREETPRMVALVDPLADPDDIETGLVAAFSLMLDVLPLVAERRANPGPDLISGLMAGPSDADGLAPDEAVLMALLLLAAGHETTANLIANAVVALHDHPLAARSLRDRPDKIPAAIEELLRYESPVQLTGRIARRDIPLGDVVVPEGSQVLISLGAANRDPAAFPDPDRFDFDRQAQLAHLAFGHGAHFCAGAALARAEAQEVLTQLLALNPPIEEREITVQRGSSPAFRRITSLLVHAA